MSDITWPDFIAQPELPDGYEWVCLAQAMGLEKHPWYIRVSWSFPHKLHGTCGRMLKIYPSFFDTAREAISAAMETVSAHKAMRQAKINPNPADNLTTKKGN